MSTPTPIPPGECRYSFQRERLWASGHDAGTAAAGGHRAGIGIGQRYLLVRGGKHLHLEKLETPHLARSAPGAHAAAVGSAISGIRR